MKNYFRAVMQFCGMAKMREEVMKHLDSISLNGELVACSESAKCY
jgi:hypothetical protein